MKKQHSEKDVAEDLEKYERERLTKKKQSQNQKKKSAKKSQNEDSDDDDEYHDINSTYGMSKEEHRRSQLTKKQLEKEDAQKGR